MTRPPASRARIVLVVALSITASTLLATTGRAQETDAAQPFAKRRPVRPASTTIPNGAPVHRSPTMKAIAAAEPQAVSFLPAAFYESGEASTRWAAVGDLNGDGIPDVATANACPAGQFACNESGIGPYEGSVSVLLGNGDGTFQSAVLYDSGGAVPTSIVIADVNGDGKPDLIVVNECTAPNQCSSNVAAILLGNGDGTFQPPVTYPSGGSSESSDFLAVPSVVVADVNGDGKLDLVVTNNCSLGCGSGTLGVLFGNGDGTFLPAVTYPSGGVWPIVAVLGDVNGDGKPDIVVANCGPAGGTGCGAGQVGVLLNYGNGSFLPAIVYPSGGAAISVALGDLQGNGNLDIVVANFSENDIAVLLGNGTGTFQPAVSYSSGGSDPYVVILSDLSRNGVLDALVTNWGSGSVGILSGNGDGTFQTPALLPLIGSIPQSVAATDLNGDGKPDLVVSTQCANDTCSEGGVAVLLNNTGSSQSPTTATLSSSPNPSIYGQSVTFTTTVTSTAGTPTGIVELFNGSTAIGSGILTGGKTSIPVSFLSAGSDSITAAYQGAPTFAATSSAPLVQRVSPASTSTSLISSLNPAVAGQSVTFTATVSTQYGAAATGSVTFFSGSQTLGTASLTAAQAILTTSFATAGTDFITAHYNGDANNSASTSATLNQTITEPTTTTLRTSRNPSIVGQPITFTAIVTPYSGTPPNGGTVTFYNGSAVLGAAPVSGGFASFATSSLLAGVYFITASYSGDASFAASRSQVALRQVVNTPTESATFTTLTSSLNPSLYGQAVTWTATVTTLGSVPPTGTVVFAWSGNTIGSAMLNSSGVATLTRSNLNADSFPLTARYKGDANNLGSVSAILNQVVNQTTSTAALTSSPNPSTPGESVAFTAKITSPSVTATGPVTFMAGNSTLGTVDLTNGKATLITSTLAAGSNKVTVTYDGNSNIEGSSASVTQVVQ